MNDREKKLAGIVGAMVVLLVVFFAYRFVAGMYDSRNLAIEDLKKKIASAERQEILAKRAAARMTRYRDQSLPFTAKNEAQNKYGSWLAEALGNAGLTKESSITKKRGVKVGEHMQYAFTVSVKSDLRGLTNFLYTFYSTDLLHRISRLKIRPIKNSKELDLDFTVEAMAVKGSTSVEELPIHPSQRLRLADVDAYRNIILSRNVFGGSNQPPQLGISERLTATRNSPVNFSAMGSDPDSLDKLKYTLKSPSSGSASIDSSTGKLSWTPSRTGEYTFTITATDDGFPPLSVNKQILVTVADPPPPPPEGPKRLEFDDAKYTILTAVLESESENQVWLQIRTKGQTLKLKVGDKIEVGSVKAVIKEIGAGRLIFEQGGKTYTIERGDNLLKNGELAVVK